MNNFSSSRVSYISQYIDQKYILVELPCTLKEVHPIHTNIYIEEKSIDREEVHLQIQNVSHIYFSERDEFKEFIRRGVLSIQQYVLVVVVLDLQQCQVQWLCLEEEKVVYGCVISRNISNQDLSLSNNHIYIHNGYELTPIPYRKSDAFHTYIYIVERDLGDFILQIFKTSLNTYTRDFSIL